jgi:integrase
MNELIVIDELEPLINLVVRDLVSENSRRTYRNAMLDFLGWWQAQGKPTVNKDLVLRYRLELKGRGKSNGTINLRLVVIRRLVAAAIDEGLTEFSQGIGILRIKDLPQRGVRAGNWLDVDQAMRLLKAPDTGTLEGLRDRAILAVLVGAGLRRSEAAGLTVEHIQMRAGRWCIVDLNGKGGRIRTIPIDGWTKQAVDAWLNAANVKEGYIFYSFDRKYNNTARPHLTGQAILNIVKHYSSECGLSIAPHDLRRTFAQLAYKGKAELVQIQKSLGHSTLTTTERYLNAGQDLVNAPCDFLGIKMEMTV